MNREVILGATDATARSPPRLCQEPVIGRSALLGLYKWRSSERQLGAKLFRIFKSMRHLTGSQCSLAKIGVN